MKTITILALGHLAFSPLACAAGQGDLIRLYEEEILAHDLYVALGREHPDIMPLRNIPRSELMHRDALAVILKSEGIKLPSPARGRRFVSEGLDETFVKWLAEGKKSARDACRVGVRLEDFDIVDLRKAQTDFPAHKEVLGQLEAASNNHLRAFHRNLTARDGEYTPEALSADDLKAILNGSGDGGPGCGGSCGSACSGPCGNTCGGKQGKGGGGQGRGKGRGATTPPAAKSK
jgi:hypothetical protein